MENTQNKKGFTLVELIIVITILAVLATIAFVSFQGAAADARDSKVATEVKSLSDATQVKAAEGVSFLSIVSGTGNTLSGATIAGTGVIVNTDYKAGGINYTVLGTDSTKYTNAYKMGATSKVNGAFSIAAKLEKSSTALISGNYNPRTTSGALSGTGVSGTKNITIPSDKQGTFKIGDITNHGLITNISSDLLTITTNTGANYSAATALTLNLANGTGETVLIATTFNGTGAITNGGSNLPY